MLDDDLAAMRVRKKLYEALDELEIIGRVREEMVDDPRRALDVIDRARRVPRVKNLAAFVVTRWKRPGPPPREPEPEPGPPTLALIEFVWSRGERDGPLVDAMLGAMAAAITRAGGFESVRPSFGRRVLFTALDDDAA